MQVQKEIRKKANTYFFSKVAFNLLLMILGAVLIALFLRQMQNQTALLKQRENSRQSLEEAVALLEQNAADAEDLTRVFHDGNQDMLDDLYELLTSGLYDSLATADPETSSQIFQDMVERSGVEYLLAVSPDGQVLISPYAELAGANLVERGLLTPKNLAKLSRGTKNQDGTIDPALEQNDYGYFYFYSQPCSFSGADFSVILGAEATTLDVQIASLKDISVVLGRAVMDNNGFLFAVSNEDDSFLYYQNGSENLTGTNAREAGLSAGALADGYAGHETINGVRYYCVSRSFGSSTVVCAVAETSEIFSDNRYVLFWSVTGFLLVMILCLTYAVIVRNDFVRNAVDTDKKIFRSRKGRSPRIFDKSVFKKVFPLLISGVLLIFGISFYTQTLLEISESIRNSVLALDEVSNRYEESAANREVIRYYYDNRFLSKARLLSYLLEENPAALNEPSSRYHFVYDKEGRKQYLEDDEGNRLKSIPASARLQELCDRNDVDSLYVFDEEGHTIATNTTNWFFTISHDPADQSYPFRQVLDGQADVCVQDPMLNDLGVAAQYIGVPFTYYTAVDENGNTVYVSHYAYEAATGAVPASAESRETEEDGEAEALARQPEADPASPVTPHHGLLQIGLDAALSQRLLASTEMDYIFSTNMLRGGFMVLFDASEDHVCLYSPFAARVGKTAQELGLSPKAFSGSDYYGFTRVSGTNYFQYFRYIQSYGDDSGYFVATAIPKDSMYQARLPIALVTAATSFVLILILLGTVTFTTEEEEMLYATMSDSEEQRGLDSAIFSIILPSGHRVSTVKASARWGNAGIPWREKNPEQKLLFLISALLSILILYAIVAVLGVNTLFDENSVIRYILSGNWDKGMNIFALSACALVLIFTIVFVTLFRIPVRLLTSLLGARGETIGHLLMSVVKYGGVLGAVFYSLYLVGLDSTSLLASAGVLSLVIGLGAQSLIRDILAGIFIVFEGEFRVGDIVTIGGFRGTVMDIGLRTTKVMAPEGNVKIYCNSEISGVLNMTKEASVAICRIDIEYGQDIAYVEAVLKRELPAVKRHNPQILEGPTYLGVSELGSSGVTIMVMCKCREQDIKDVTRYLNRSVLQIFYDNGINVPFPNVTVSQLDTSTRKTMKDFNKETEENSEA